MKRYLTTKDVCDLLGCSPQTLWRRVNAKSFPAPTYPGKPNKWLANVVAEYESALIQKTLKSMPLMRAGRFLEKNKESGLETMLVTNVGKGS